MTQLIVFLKTVQAPVKCQVEGTVFFYGLPSEVHFFKVYVVPAHAYVIITLPRRREVFTDMRIRPADARDLDAVAQSYRDLLMHEMEQTGYSNWRFGVFPTMEISHRAHSRQELYVAEAKGRLIGSMILTESQPKEYRRISWSEPKEKGKVLVLQVLCVRPQFFGKGFGKSLLRYAGELARDAGYDMIRCNMWEGNAPAIHVFRQMGFQDAGTAAFRPEGLPEEQDLFMEWDLSTSDHDRY